MLNLRRTASLITIILVGLLGKKVFDIASTELLITSITTEGCKIIQKDEIENRPAIRDMYKKSILRVNVKNVRRDLMKMPFIEEVIVQKKYPHTIKIDIIEREPLFLISSNKQNYIYDKAGVLFKIDKEDLKRDTVLHSLLYIEGDNIIKEVEFLADALLNQKFSKRISGFYQIGGRRWDMIIDKKIKVMLPEVITKESLISVIHLLDTMKSKNNVKSGSLYTIFDARIKDKIFVKNIGDEG